MCDIKKKVRIYTDGGCSPNPGLGSWGAIIISDEYNNSEKELSGAELDSTNNKMEMTAVIKALEMLQEPCEIVLYTDSEYVQKPFTAGWLDNWQKNNWRTADKKPVKNQDIWQRLLELTKMHDIEWVWVKGHAGDKFNERCDKLVLDARNSAKWLQL